MIAKKLLIDGVSRHGVQIEVLDHGMEDGSLTAVIDRLTELYLESSEIDAKLLKR